MINTQKIQGGQNKLNHWLRTTTGEWIVNPLFVKK